MKWFRFYSEALDDPKVQLLPVALFRGWINVLSIVNETEPSRGPRSGYLPAKVEDIAYKLHLGIEETSELLTDLVAAGLLEDKSARLRAHNWARRQPVSDDVAARVSATRKTRTGNTDVTLHVRNNRRTSTAPEGEGEGEEIQRRSRGEGEEIESEKRAAPNGAVPSSSLGSASSWDFSLSLYRQNIGEPDVKTRNEVRSLFDRSPDPSWFNAAVNQTTAAREPGFGYFKRTLEDCIAKNEPPASLKKSHRQHALSG